MLHELEYEILDTVIFEVGAPGPPGASFTFEDFTPEQLAALKVKGDKGEPFTYDDFTPAQLAALKGADGETPTLRMSGAKLQWKLPSQSAWTDLYDFTGLLWLKGTETARLGITSPTEGTLYFQTDKAKGLYAFKGGAWHITDTRLRKEVGTSTYTLAVEDIGYLLVFTNDGGCTVTVPSNVFNANHEVVMLQEGGVITVTNGVGLAISTVPYLALSSAGVNSIIYLMFKTATSAILKGEQNLI